jgi:rod shape-determining protein MreC
LAVAQDVTGSIYSVTSGFQAYMNLSATNHDLLNKITELETKIYQYRKTIELLTDSSRMAGFEIEDVSNTPIYRFTLARVINNNVSNLENYITLDKGSEDGVEPDMGVLSVNGIVGVVVYTSPHCSVVIPILNSKFKLSSKVKNNNYSGPLVWDGKDSRYASLMELPRHVDFDIGDTIVTSGYSTIFPEGLPVGTIEDSKKQQNDNYTSLKIKLFTNFNTLNEVIIVENSYQKEQKRLQEMVNR